MHISCRFRPVNCIPLSVSEFFGYHHFGKKSPCSTFAILDVCALLIGYAFTHLEKLSVTTTMKRLPLVDLEEGPIRWCVLFSHPADFTPVCTTELGRMAVHDHEFKKRGVKVIAHSCDKLQDHKNWVADIKSYCLDIPGEFPYPIIGDEKRELAVLLDMIDEDSKNDPATALTVRSLYIIGPDKKLKLSMLYPASTGRNVDEILRVIDSLQLTSRLKVVATPANWTPGTKVMILPEVKDEDLPKLFPKGVEKVSMPSGITYVRTTTDY